MKIGEQENSIMILLYDLVDRSSIFQTRFSHMALFVAWPRDDTAAKLNKW